MITYWVLFLGAAILSSLSLLKNTKNLQSVSFIYLYFFIVFVTGFKYASIDYFGYEELFYNTNLNDFSFPFFKGALGTTGKEYLWATISSVFKFLGFAFPIWVFFIALVSVSIKFYYFKKFTPYFLLAVAIYITQSFIKDMGQIRNGLAGAILLFSVMPIIKRDVFKFVLVVLAAFGVQAYAIIALPLYWLYPFFARLKYNLILSLILLSLLSFYGGIAELILNKVGASSLINERVMHKLEGYSERDVTNLSIVSITGISYVLISVLLILWKERVHERNPVLTVFSMFHYYGVFLFLLFTGINTLNNRSLDLFSMTSLPFILVIPLLFSKGVTKTLLSAMVLFFCSLRLYANTEAFNEYITIFSIY